MSWASEYRDDVLGGGGGCSGFPTIHGPLCPDSVAWAQDC